jgi:ankyrin repeat protein
VAAKAGHGRVVELLLEHGAETEPRLGTRRNSAVAELPGGSLVRDTPLHAAIRYHACA